LTDEKICFLSFKGKDQGFKSFLRQLLRVASVFFGFEREATSFSRKEKNKFFKEPTTWNSISSRRREPQGATFIIEQSFFLMLNVSNTLVFSLIMK
jgi:hypothetical protein